MITRDTMVHACFWMLSFYALKIAEWLTTSAINRAFSIRHAYGLSTTPTLLACADVTAHARAQCGKGSSSHNNSSAVECCNNIVSRVSSHGHLNVTHNSGSHGRLPEIKIPYVRIEAATLIPWNGVHGHLPGTLRYYATVATEPGPYADIYWGGFHITIGSPTNYCGHSPQPSRESGGMPPPPPGKFWEIQIPWEQFWYIFVSKFYSTCIMDNWWQK